ncbi:hemolysin family protein [uncultured Cohaesibacter sp.]|uniref:hemolysin family protein n=1 Tax=uncultured Cohaesibacter sp. TaxID=1002546 RepID=UPI0029C6167B|nr:hemolysin family protein [uncultured Cohaesibacter sp.]
MNDPDPSQPASSHMNGSAVAASSNAQSNGETSLHEGSWLQRLTQSFVAKLPNTSLRTQMEGALAEESGDDAFSAEEKAMLRNILALREMRVDDVMVPRADIDAVEHDISLGTLLAVYEDVGHSRLPVYRETLDDPVGMVHIKDVLGLMTQESGIGPVEDSREGSSALDSMEGADAASNDRAEEQSDEPAASNRPGNLDNVDLDRPLKDLGLIRDVLFVPPSMPAVDLMASMRAARTQMALVIDEYGGTDGLVSLEDVVETVVGDIEDEHDDESEVFIAEAGPNLFIADAKADLDDVVETIGVPLPIDEEDRDDVDTLGGFIFTLIGRIPVRGELISVSEGLEFEIMEADRRRIRRVKIRLKPTKKPIKRPVALTRSATDEPQGAAHPEEANASPEAPADDHT